VRQPGLSVFEAPADNFHIAFFVAIVSDGRLTSKSPADSIAMAAAARLDFRPVGTGERCASLTAGSTLQRSPQTSAGLLKIPCGRYCHAAAARLDSSQREGDSQASTAG